MVRVRESFGRYGMLGALLALVALGIAATISSCGGGGGSSNGGLCEQCGDTDGPCQTSVNVSGSDAATLCPSGQASCNVTLACFRQLTTSQRRCFPAAAQFEQFECDGGRALRNTPTPTATPTVTPTGTLTPTVTGVTPTPTSTTSTAGSTPTPTPTPTTTPAACGNGKIDEGEECDGTLIDAVGGNCDSSICTCADFCDLDSVGSLSCNSDCTVNFSKCTLNDACSF